MTAPAFLQRIWGPDNLASLDGYTARLIRVGGVPKGDRGRDPQKLWHPAHYLNLLLAGAVPDTGSNMMAVLNAWRSATLARSASITTGGAASYLLRQKGTAPPDAVGGDTLDFVREWEASISDEMGLDSYAAGLRHSKRLPKRILPGTTLAEALESLIERLSVPAGINGAKALVQDKFQVELAWGGDGLPCATIRYFGSVTIDGHVYPVTWEGLYVVKGLGAGQSIFGRSVTLSAPVFLRIAEAWAQTKALISPTEKSRPDGGNAPASVTLKKKGVTSPARKVTPVKGQVTNSASTPYKADAIAGAGSIQLLSTFGLDPELQCQMALA